MADTDDRWERYGRAMLQAMQEVLAETPADLHPLLLETADYWLSLGLAIGRSDPDAAAGLLDVIEADGPERSELDDDAAQFAANALA